MNNLELYKKVKQPPEWAKKTIQAGRLKGKTDINPQWRYEVLTEQFGICGIGWKYIIKKLWLEKAGDEMLSFAEIDLYVKNGENWSDPIPGIGGNKMITKEKEGFHNSDECFKMAVTDALSVACKMIGIGADVYSGGNHDSKYEKSVENKLQPTKSQPTVEIKPKTEKTPVDMAVSRIKHLVAKICKDKLYSDELTINTWESVSGVIADVKNAEKYKGKTLEEKIFNNEKVLTTAITNDIGAFIADLPF